MRAAVYSKNPHRRRVKTGFFPYFSNHGVGRRLVKIDSAPRGAPFGRFGLAYEENTVTVIEHDACNRR
jgi:hypothetical protein